jgi:hypothetical protein
LFRPSSFRSIHCSSEIVQNVSHSTRKKILVEIISSAGEPFKQDPFEVSLLRSSDGTKPDVELLSESLLKNSKALKKVSDSSKYLL